MNKEILFENDEWIVVEEENEIIITHFTDFHYDGEIHISEKEIYSI